MIKISLVIEDGATGVKARCDFEKTTSTSAERSELSKQRQLGGFQEYQNLLKASLERLDDTLPK